MAEQREKRIAIVCFSYSLGGLELSALHLSESMRSKEVSTLLVVPPSSPLEARAAASGVETVTMMPRWKYFDVRAIANLLRLIRERRIDVVLLMRSQDINIASIAKVFHPSVHVVFYQQMRTRHNKRDPLHTWIYSKLSLWVTLTQGMKDDVLDCTQMPASKVIVVPLGTDLRRFDPAVHDRAEARRSFSLPDDRMILGVLGRLDPGKGQEVFIRAVPEVIREHPDTLFVIAGDETAGEPGYKKHLERVCAELCIQPHIRFMRFTDDVPRLLAALDVMVLPSFSETFGLIVIEAMAMQTPIIATNAGGVPEIISDNATGLLVEPRDEHSLARAIRRLLSDDGLRRMIAQRGRTAAVERYDFDHCVEALVKAVTAL